jgi:plasmid stabilization system protein ParE
VKTRFTARAETDVVEIQRWYRAQEGGVETAFLTALDSCLASIERFPLAHPALTRRARRIRLARFPYNIVYRIEAEDIVIIAVYHTSRGSRELRRRLH